MILRALFGFALLLFICNVYCNNWVIFKSSKKIGTKSNEKVLTFLFESQITGTIYNEKKFWFTFVSFVGIFCLIYTNFSFL